MSIIHEEGIEYTELGPDGFYRKRREVITRIEVGRRPAMPELVRSVKVSVVVETNKNTYRQTFEIGEDETADEFFARVGVWADEYLWTGDGICPDMLLPHPCGKERAVPAR